MEDKTWIKIGLHHFAICHLVNLHLDKSWTMSGLTDVLSLSTFCQGFWTPTRRVNVHIIVFIVRTNTGQLSYLCPAFVLTKANGPWPIAHSPPNPLPTKTNYRQMLDNAIRMNFINNSCGKWWCRKANLAQTR